MRYAVGTVSGLGTFCLRPRPLGFYVVIDYHRHPCGLANLSDIEREQAVVFTAETLDDATARCDALNQCRPRHSPWFWGF